MDKKFRVQQWRMLFITMFCYLFFYTGRHNFGWAAKGMAIDLGIPYSTIGWISFSMLIGYSIGQFINGNLADRFSARLMVSVGAYLSILSNVAISFSSRTVVVMVLWTFNGYFQSMAWAPGARLINNWWGEAERGKAFGFYTMAAGLSSVVTYLLSIILLQQGYEWRMLFRLPVLLLLISATAFLFIAKDSPETIKEQVLANQQELNWRERYLHVFKNKKFMAVSLSFGFESMARYGLIFWVPVHYLGSHWKDNPGNLWVTFLLPVGMAAGAVTFGMLSDHLFKQNRMRAISFGMLASGIIALSIYLIPSGNLILGGVLMLLAGFFVYGPQACYWPLSPDLLDNKLTGTGIGFMNMIGYLFAAIGEPLLGFAIDISGSTNSIFIVIACLCVLSVLSINLVSFMREDTSLKRQIN